MTPEQYALKNLSEELRLVKEKIEPLLTDYEKAIIYKYSEDGFENLNETLRLTLGRTLPIFGKVLLESLSKLPDYEGLVFRGEKLTNLEQQAYIEAFNNDTPIVKCQFYSSSMSKELASMYGTTIIKIYSLTGKRIDHIAKFGIDDSQNEKEVLFRYNTIFEVLSIDQDEDSGKLISVYLYEIKL